MTSDHVESYKRMEKLRNRLTKEIEQAVQETPGMQNEEVVIAFATIIGEMIDRKFIDKQMATRLVKDGIATYLKAAAIERRKKP